jgi:hypothetical protein
MLRARGLSVAAAIVLTAVPQPFGLSAQVAAPGASNSVAVASGQFPLPESLYYSIEWRMWYAGNARLTLRPHHADQWESDIHLESAGMVSKLFTVNDSYTAELDTNRFCADDTSFDAREGSHHKLTTVQYDYHRHQASYTERDVQRNAVLKTAEAEIPACVTDVIGGLMRLRTMRLEPTQSIQIPTSDGRKFVNVRVDAQERETIETKLGKFQTVRYEANIFNGVLYTKKARMFVWLTDDARRLPVQIRVRMQFVSGPLTLTLDKEEHADKAIASR